MLKLPQNENDDHGKQMRQVQISNRQKEYDYTKDSLPTIPRLKGKLPAAEAFDERYQRAADLRLAGTTSNHVSALIAAVPFNDVTDYEKLYPLIPRPKSVQGWQRNDRFAEQRLSGANPMVIYRVAADRPLPGDHKFSDVDIRRIAGPGATLASVAQEGRLYCCDYSILSGLPNGTQPAPKVLPSPIALFYWRTRTGDQNWGELEPVAVQLRHTDGSHEIVNPLQGFRWSVARWSVQAADANHHEMGSHLCRTHLVLEPFAIAFQRNLADNHPLRPLLWAHLRFLLAINHDARIKLIRPKAFVDNLLGSTLDGSLQIVQRSYDAWSFWDTARFPEEIKSRGLDDTTKLPHYPYRDDGQLVWDAIVGFVTDYIKIAYQNDAAVKADTELQAMVTELNDPARGAVKKLTPDGKVETMAVLAQVVAGIIWTSGPQHSAVNYPQWDYIGFPPNMPLALWTDPKRTNLTTMQILPPLPSAIEQLDTMNFLGTYRYDRLGVYAKPFDDAQLSQRSKDFMLKMMEVDNKIAQRNQKRNVPYPYLRPTNITNSTSV